MNVTTSIATKSLIERFFQLYPGEAARLLDTFSVEEIVNYLQIRANVPHNHAESRTSGYSRRYWISEFQL